MKKAQTHLLEHLYSHMNELKEGVEGEGLLEEDPQTAQRRAAGKQSLQVRCNSLASMLGCRPRKACGTAGMESCVQA